MSLIDYLKEIEYFKEKDLSYAFDSLTQILSRSEIVSYIDWLTANKREFSFFLVDIDNFKNVNDTYGHSIGDVVLAQTAHFLVKKTEQRGVVGRYGGDEFIMVFEGVTEYNEVWSYAHNIDMSIGSLVFDGIPHLSITVSIGIARSPLNAANYSELFSVADRALYRAKMKGRNCFIIYLPEKHANISIKADRDRKLTSMQICGNIFSSLTANGEDIEKSILSVFRSMVSYYMYDHMCVESERGLNFSVVHMLSIKKDFKHIDCKKIASLMNSAGYVRLNNALALNPEVYSEILEDFKSQGIMSTLYCKIAAYGVTYGYLRVDTASTGRIWQNEEISFVMTVANTLGILLHYQNKNLDELPQTSVIEAGSVD